MKAPRIIGVVCVLFVAAAAVAHAQTPHRIERFDAQQERTATVPAMAAGGLVGGALGLVVFGYMGALIADSQARPEEDLAAVGGFVLGGTIGEALMLPLGVHLVNQRRGNYGTAALVSLGIAAGGVALALATEDQAPLPGAILIAIPIAQIASSIAIERRAAR